MNLESALERIRELESKLAYASHFAARTEAAEAQLAAVRTAVERWTRFGIAGDCARQILALLTPAPSPGAVRDMDWAAVQILAAARAANCAVKYELKALPSPGAGETP